MRTFNFDNNLGSMFYTGPRNKLRFAVPYSGGRTRSGTRRLSMVTTAIINAFWYSSGPGSGLDSVEAALPLIFYHEVFKL